MLESEILYTWRNYCLGPLQYKNCEWAVKLFSVTNFIIQKGTKVQINFLYPFCFLFYRLYSLIQFFIFIFLLNL